MREKGYLKEELFNAFYEGCREKDLFKAVFGFTR
jgi:hypothetical protein